MAREKPNTEEIDRIELANDFSDEWGDWTSCGWSRYGDLEPKEKDLKEEGSRCRQ